MVALRDRVGRNERCPCGSGKKYKRCCLGDVQDSRFMEMGELAPQRPLPIPNRQLRSKSGWWELHCYTQFKDGTQLYLVLLHSDQWLSEHKMDVDVLAFDLPEINLSGFMEVEMIMESTTVGPSEGHLHLAVHRKDETDPGEVWVGRWKPAEDAAERERQNHRKLILRMDHPDGSHIRMWLRRSLDWIAEHKAEVGGKVFLNLPEQGARGWADVIDIIQIEPRKEPLTGRNRGKLVTGFFHHSEGWVGDLKIASEPEPIGVTPSHLFWSVDRNDWVSVGDLKVGERVKTLNGISHVEWYKMRPDPEPVYNLEVEGDHVYRVGHSGILVHNASCSEYLLGLKQSNESRTFTPGATNASDFQTDYCGSTEYHISSGSTAVWADGIREDGCVALDCKYPENPDSSPQLGNATPFFTMIYRKKQLDELRKYETVISDSCNPLTKLTVVCVKEAVPFWTDLVSQLSIDTEVVGV